MGSRTQLKTLSLQLTISVCVGSSQTIRCPECPIKTLNTKCNISIDFFYSMEAEKYRITGVPGRTKVLFRGAELELQWQSLEEQMFTPHYICLSRRAD